MLSRAVKILTTRNIIQPLRFCSSNLPQLFDGGGKVLAPDPDLDYYKVFGLERSFQLDLGQLSSTYKQLQRQLHPDKFSLAPSEDVEVSVQWSTLVNEAYKTLQKPLPRALYLLSIAGYPLEEASVDVDPAFLGEVMELNEELSEAGEVEIKILEDKVRESLDNYLMTIEVLFANEQFEAARQEAAHMKYYASIHDKIFEIQTEFGMY